MYIYFMIIRKISQIFIWINVIHTICKIQNTVKPVIKATYIKQLPVLKGQFFIFPLKEM